MKWCEVNFDGLIGPSHHYGGLALGNLASDRNKQQVANPKAAALQGLDKMSWLLDQGFRQAIFPPAPRPSLAGLKKFDYTLKSLRHVPLDLLSQVYSASSMWAANAATISPAPDCHDGKTHITPANLLSNFHRSLELPFTTRLLNFLFNMPDIIVHDALPDHPDTADEGAANHLRLSSSHGEPGVELMVYGRDDHGSPARFPGRQTLQSINLLRNHHKTDIIPVQQNPDVIDQGVFHNDVIAVSNENVLLLHEDAFVSQPEQLNRIREKIPDLQVCEISRTELPVEEAVNSYFFNSQLLSHPDGGMILLLPIEARENPFCEKICNTLNERIPSLKDCHYINVRQSMRNGGGPACLRLRVVLNERQIDAFPGRVLLDQKIIKELRAWVTYHYREDLHLEDLYDPELPDEIKNALYDLEDVLRLPGLYREYEDE